MSGFDPVWCAMYGHQWFWYGITTWMQQPGVPNGARCLRCGEYRIRGPR